MGESVLPALGPWHWLIAGLILAGLEIVVSGVFLIWIGFGAIAVGLVLAFAPELSLSVQIGLFAALTLISTATGFLIQRRSGPSEAADQINQELRSLVGRTVEVATDFAAGRGRVRIGDTTYSALGPDQIRAGQWVRIDRIEHGQLCVIARPDEDSSDTGA